MKKKILAAMLGVSILNIGVPNFYTPTNAEIIIANEYSLEFDATKGVKKSARSAQCNRLSCRRENILRVCKCLNFARRHWLDFSRKQYFRMRQI